MTASVRALRPLVALLAWTLVACASGPPAASAPPAPVAPSGVSPGAASAPPDGVVRAAVPAAEMLRVGHSTTSGSASPLWVARDRGFFAREGLDVELLFVA